MIVFLDFEASSLSKESFPVEVAWVFEDGRSRSFLINPPKEWTDWADDAEKIHGLSRERLLSEGTPVDDVAGCMVEELAGHDLYASAPSWDGKWLSVLLRGAGLPRHALRLRKSDEAFLEAARIALGDVATDLLASEIVSKILKHTEVMEPAHRALADAMLELDRWVLVTKEAVRRADQLKSPSRRSPTS